MTNILAFLHTTAAYKAAVAQLLVGEANFVAQRLNLPSVPTKTNQLSYSDISSPTQGVEGSLGTGDYSFDFTKGRLRSVQKRDWFKKITPPVQDLFELAERPSLLDTNSAYQLATQWLAAVAVDVTELERKFPAVVFHLRARNRDADGRRLPGVANIPLFMIGWGDEPMNPLLREKKHELNRPMPQRPPSSSSPVFVEILGTTKELLELKINDPSFLKRPELQIKNADELLGPLPPPRHFVEELLGGKITYETIANPDKVESWLLTSHSTDDEPLKTKDRAGAITVRTEIAKTFSDTLINFDSYSWGMSKGCVPDFGARLRFRQGDNVVGIRLCYECGILEVTHNEQTHNADFDPAYNTLVKAIQAVFPGDGIITNLKLHNQKPQ